MKDTVILVPNNGMGKADLPLGQKLISKYFELLALHTDLPAAICFYTEGVKLVIDDSPVLGQLKELEARGVHLIVCSTCLDYFNITDRMKIGIVGGMSDIIEAQMKAEKVITI
jgi:selenium metabolism protein YedF